jgi:hypothetical protein
MLQLVRMDIEDMGAHVPTPVYSTEIALRKDTDKLFLDLVGTVAKVTRYKPQ